MEIFFTISVFSLLAILGVIAYLFVEKHKTLEQQENGELLKERLERLENYVYELELKVLTPNSKLKQNIIQMYKDGKDIPFIEHALKVPRPKIEIILKQYKRESNNLS